MGTQTPHRTRVAILRHARIPMLVAFLLATVLVLRVPVLQLRGGHARAEVAEFEARPSAQQAASELPTAGEIPGRIPSSTSSTDTRSVPSTNSEPSDADRDPPLAIPQQATAPDQVDQFDDQPSFSTLGTELRFQEEQPQGEPADTEPSSVTTAENGPDEEVADKKSRRDLSEEEQLALQDVHRMMDGVIRLLCQVHQHIEAQP